MSAEVVIRLRRGSANGHTGEGSAHDPLGEAAPAPTPEWLVVQLDTAELCDAARSMSVTSGGFAGRERADVEVAGRQSRLARWWQWVAAARTGRRDKVPTSVPNKSAPPPEIPPASIHRQYRVFRKVSPDAVEALWQRRPRCLDVEQPSDPVMPYRRRSAVRFADDAFVYYVPAASVEEAGEHALPDEVGSACGRVLLHAVTDRAYARWLFPESVPDDGQAKRKVRARRAGTSPTVQETDIPVLPPNEVADDRWPAPAQRVVRASSEWENSGASSDDSDAIGDGHPFIYDPPCAIDDAVPLPMDTGALPGERHAHRVPFNLPPVLPAAVSHSIEVWASFGADTHEQREGSPYTSLEGSPEED
ncbi:hypothetical protein CDCA_CDCA13G3668 [Cyanidium caldarium]|uniref:Uncharacterized protein n=1 Tax=Cyanidium caldarium TaxID=2771 RepID=A0AAV9IZ72_CYACA|nr:hypothetical protein CDCA_CDCA13G3668 [Cyanidium caldarium]